MKISSYLNPASEVFHSCRDFKKLSAGEKVGVVAATAFATLLTLPLLGIGGLVTFRAMVTNFSNNNNKNSSNISNGSFKKENFESEEQIRNPEDENKRLSTVFENFLGDVKQPVENLEARQPEAVRESESVDVQPEVVEEVEPEAAQPGVVEEVEPEAAQPGVVEEFEPEAAQPGVVEEFEPVAAQPEVVEQFESEAAQPEQVVKEDVKEEVVVQPKRSQAPFLPFDSKSLKRKARVLKPVIAGDLTAQFKQESRAENSLQASFVQQFDNRQHLNEQENDQNIENENPQAWDEAPLPLAKPQKNDTFVYSVKQAGPKTAEEYKELIETSMIRLEELENSLEKEENRLVAKEISWEIDDLKKEIEVLKSHEQALRFAKLRAASKENLAGQNVNMGDRSKLERALLGKQQQDVTIDEINKWIKYGHEGNLLEVLRKFVNSMEKPEYLEKVDLIKRVCAGEDEFESELIQFFENRI